MNNSRGKLNFKNKQTKQNKQNPEYNAKIDKYMQFIFINNNEIDTL